MKNVFQFYGKCYDTLYEDKDYEKECDFLEEIFEKYSPQIPKTILDCGCGTGGHSIPLARRGYTVTGVDSSEEMIRIAKEKARKNRAKIDFKVIDLNSLQLNRKFDACISMFAVINYLTGTQDLLEALIRVRKHLKDNSLFVFDFWYGPAVLKILPSPRMKIIEKNGLRIIRFAEPHLDTLRNVCEISYYVLVIKENLIKEEIKERHFLRYFFPGELEHYLNESHFELVKLNKFLELHVKPSEETWNASGIAKAIRIEG